MIGLWLTCVPGWSGQYDWTDGIFTIIIYSLLILAFLCILKAQLVSKELIRVAILWHEMWHEALEEASRLYFGEHNIEGMLKVLEPLHELLEEGAMGNNTTIKEKAFIQVIP